MNTTCEPKKDGIPFQPGKGDVKPESIPNGGTIPKPMGTPAHHGTGSIGNPTIPYRITR